MNASEIPTRAICQSCGLPLDAPGLLGTDAAGGCVSEYCVYCYHRGAFTEPQMTREEMIERVACLLMKEQHLRRVQARDVAERFVPDLKRWNGPVACPMQGESQL